LLTGRLTTVGPIVAIETMFGWTAMGKMVDKKTARQATLLTTTLFSQAKVADLWRLEVLGITDPTTAMNDKEEQKETALRFQNTIVQQSCGRYQVELPWKLSAEEPSSNREAALKRTKIAGAKLGVG